jgi:hypothetical protein
MNMPNHATAPTERSTSLKESSSPIIQKSNDKGKKGIRRDHVSIITVTPTPVKKAKYVQDNDACSPEILVSIIEQGQKTLLASNDGGVDHHQNLVNDFDAAGNTDERYVPHYLYKNLQYRRKGEADLNTGARKAFDLIEENYFVPQNFESSRIYGPWSGSSYEERLINAYECNLLQPKVGSILFCCACGEVGHSRRLCPSLL